MSILINAKQNAFFLSYNVCALILSANIVILLLYYSYFSLCLVYRDNSVKSRQKNFLAWQVLSEFINNYLNYFSIVISEVKTLDLSAIYSQLKCGHCLCLYKYIFPIEMNISFYSFGKLKGAQNKYPSDHW